LRRKPSIRGRSIKEHKEHKELERKKKT